MKLLVAEMEVVGTAIVVSLADEVALWLLLGLLVVLIALAMGLR